MKTGSSEHTGQVDYQCPLDSTEEAGLNVCQRVIKEDFDTYRKATCKPACMPMYMHKKKTRGRQIHRITVTKPFFLSTEK